MELYSTLKEHLAQAFQECYGTTPEGRDLPLGATKSDFEGDITLTLFPLAKKLQQNPEAVGQRIGAYLVENASATVAAFNVIKGFLNLTFQDSYWLQQLQRIAQDKDFGQQTRAEQATAMVEYSSPNTNKPLHLGHIRNILLGWSMVQLLQKAGYRVIKTQVINNRGIAICKSMLAWQRWGEGATPESTGIKGDRFVGDYYVLFEQKFKAEYAAWQQTPSAQAILTQKKKETQTESEFFTQFKNTYFNEYSDLGKAAREMLLQWEQGEPTTLALWEQMNGWVYEGFDSTYAQLGVNFDKNYYESDTYLLGKDMIEKGLAQDVFYKKEDGSVWVDLTDRKLDHKVVLRGDGTAIYITQDIGMAPMRYAAYHFEKCIFVVADEQNYHFQVLFEILKKMGEPYAEGMYHLSYGMVELPTGKMKSREGTVVDADDLIAEVIKEARAAAEERGEPTYEDASAQANLYRQVGLAALKFHILKVNPKKKMIFDPKESVDLQGHTGPYIQNAYVRIRSIIRKLEEVGLMKNEQETAYTALHAAERTLIKWLQEYPLRIQEAAQQYDPAIIADYAYQLAKHFHRFYHDVSIMRAESGAAQVFRLTLSEVVARTLRDAMGLLGIEMPERM